MAKPGGTRTPTAAKARYSSPREAFFPPTSGMSSKPRSANQRIYSTSVVDDGIWGLLSLGLLMRSCHIREARGVPQPCGDGPDWHGVHERLLSQVSGRCRR